MEFPFPVLLCDIGGTNARFAFVPNPGAPPEPGPHLLTKDYPDLEEALAAVLPRFGIKPRSLIACTAGPVMGRSVVLTNANWTIDGLDVAARAKLDQGLLLNDFEAQAYSLPVLAPDWVKPIGEGFAASPGTQLIMGLGTGLGVAALVEAKGRYLALATEAGHMDLGATEADEFAIWPFIARPLGRISAETVLSGPGLLRLHLARCAAAGETTAITSEIALVDKARADPEGPEAATLRHCWRLIARFAGDLALAFLATGGVTFSGGVLPKIAEFCDPVGFRAIFENKPPLGNLLSRIGIRLITCEDAVLHGMAAIAAAPQNYAIDYALRAWR